MSSLICICFLVSILFEKFQVELTWFFSNIKVARETWFKAYFICPLGLQSNTDALANCFAI